jgi:alkanesulfonate monooxygenase SsuD/methylene tetrahydromethanopterin reductase-like flavin-dependent oxidoreductase (luciferase family)
VSFDPLFVEPRPVAGSVPIVVGGHSEVAARRAGRLGDGFFPGPGREDELAGLLATMRAAAEEAGRDPDAIEVTTGGMALMGPDPLAAVERYLEMGVSRLVIPPLSYDPTQLEDVLGTFAGNVIRQTRP